MVKDAFVGEFLHEAENTRKLLHAIPDKALEYRPQPHLWSIGQLASHIVEIYSWYKGVFQTDYLDMGQYKYDHGDITKTSNIINQFEQNFTTARSILETSDEGRYMNLWSMGAGDTIFFGPMPRVQVIRGFLFNHLYHHRGELVAHLRASGNSVPGLYGPNYEDSKKMKG